MNGCIYEIDLVLYYCEVNHVICLWILGVTL